MAPHDREHEAVALLVDLGIAGHACVLLGRPADELDIDAVLRAAWDLAEVQRLYKEFVDEFAQYQTLAAQRQLDDREAFAICTRATHEFRQFPFMDPELPDRLMPRPSARPKAIAAFRKVRAGLHARAARHFGEV